MPLPNPTQTVEDVRAAVESWSREFSTITPEQLPPLILSEFLRGVGNQPVDPPSEEDVEAVVDSYYAELCRIRDSDPQDFWVEVARASWLPEFLDNFLRFSHKIALKTTKLSFNGVNTAVGHLHLEIFFFYHHMFYAEESGITSEHAVLLKEKKYMDFPKLLDICIHYTDLMPSTGCLVTRIITYMPYLLDNISTTLSYFSITFNTYYHRCMRLFKILATSPGTAVGIRYQLRSDFSEINMFLVDAVATLYTFVDAYKPAAIYLSCPFEFSKVYEDMLMLLGRLWDILIPSYKVEFREALCFSCILKEYTIKLGGTLLETCYLSDTYFMKNLDLKKVTKRFPAMIDDPIRRGQIFYKAITRVSKEVSPLINGMENHDTLLQSIEKECNLSSKVNSLGQKGWMALDDQQQSTISKMLKSLRPDHSSEKEMATLSPPTTEISFEEISPDCQ